MTQALFSKLVLVWIAIAMILFPILLKVTAPYGRHTKNSWGPLIDNRIGWFLMELPALLIFAYFLIRWGDFHNTVVLIAFILWIIHYFHRAVIFPFRINTGGKKMPVIIMLFAVFFNLFNGFFNGYWLGHLVPDFSSSSINYMRIAVGIALFITGFVINQYHDKILINLRKNNKNSYQIPYGGLFRYISCPNFFGEIIEWLGFAVLVWSLPALSFLIWTWVNLVPRAIDHHRWYRGKFADYPSDRKAVIPFIL
jgi:protein-S-isoprenylcysteine O-methyltransferase Ste14